MQTTITFADGDQVTSAKLNEITSGLSFTSSDITGTTLVVTGGQLKVGTVTQAELDSLCISTRTIVDDAVTTVKIAAGAITTGKVANLAITGEKIANNTVTFSNISSSAVASQSAMQLESASRLVSADSTKYAPGAAKAYGEFNITSDARDVKSGSLNIQSLTRIDTNRTAVSVDTNMFSANYTVMATYVSTGSTGESGTVAVYDKSTTGFKLYHPTQGADRAVNFVVFGKYA